MLQPSEARRLVLIVEDDDRSRKLVRDLLQFHGFETIETDNAEDAIELARTVQPQLILMDIRLPGMDGEQALSLLRGDEGTAGIPIVAVTASVMRGDEQRFLRLGFDGYIAKPIDVLAFPGAVRDYCDRGRHM